MCPRKRVGLVSGVVPHISSRGALVSARPPITSWRYLGWSPIGPIRGEITKKAYRRRKEDLTRRLEELEK